jgi:hypothetical protein
LFPLWGNAKGNGACAGVKIKIKIKTKIKLKILEISDKTRAILAI